jgi:gamma-glutamyl:cysteine ligase YbdK (ATP-grasp superfamily)
VVKDKTKKTQEMEKAVEDRYASILEERGYHDEQIVVAGETARAVVAGIDDHDELVRIANSELARIRRSH